MIQQCEACRRGEIPLTSCMRSEAHRKGVCPIEDSAPGLSAENEHVLEIYEQIKGTAVQISSEDRNWQFLRATEAQAALELAGIEPEDRSEIWRRLVLLQDVANWRRPVRPKKPRGR